MQLGDIIRSFSECAAASEALLACNDIVLSARVGEAANRYEETVGEYASGAVRRGGGCSLPALDRDIR
ncbi:MAG: hypothetical protein V4458_08990 [Pseudomonadota bacterium]|jgi:hypothetical protein|nr:hypothetical protein [Afipia sp.]